jgi:hypothetical protein
MVAFQRRIPNVFMLDHNLDLVQKYEEHSTSSKYSANYLFYFNRLTIRKTNI